VTAVLENPWIALLAILVAVVGVARLTRAIVHDDFPPFVWWRIKWSTWTNDGPWSKLFLCWWCLSFWVALTCIGWFLLIDVNAFFLWSWWIFWGGLALSYVATMLIVRDEPKE
jgi:undecaprenyl pyrophosphate phosphatase UppP